MDAGHLDCCFLARHSGRKESQRKIVTHDTCRVILKPKRLLSLSCGWVHLNSINHHCRMTASDPISCYWSRQTLTSPTDSVLCLMRTAHQHTFRHNTQSDGNARLCPMKVPDGGSSLYTGKSDFFSKDDFRSSNARAMPLPSFTCTILL